MWWTISSAQPSLGASWSATARQRRNISETDKKLFREKHWFKMCTECSSMKHKMCREGWKRPSTVYYLVCSMNSSNSSSKVNKRVKRAPR